MIETVIPVLFVPSCSVFYVSIAVKCMLCISHLNPDNSFIECLLGIFFYQYSGSVVNPLILDFCFNRMMPKVTVKMKQSNDCSIETKVKHSNDPSAHSQRRRIDLLSFYEYVHCHLEPVSDRLNSLFHVSLIVQRV
jgi:hypothetical protein